MKTQTFAIDASLLEELGERLIGRAPIALAELIKNAYDADAPTCRLEFGADSIVVSDDGSGMSEGDFLAHWMRIGTTHKIDEGTSPNGRALTGSKGIGRLSVQFLADEMTLESTAAGGGRTLHAYIDWSEVVRGNDLSTVRVNYESNNKTPEYPNGHPTGTRITLRRLKNTWDASAIEALGKEVWRLRSPFKRLPKAKKERRPEEFEIELIAPAIEGAVEAFEKVRRALFENWKARISGKIDGGRRGDTASITVEFRQGYPDKENAAESYHETVRLPVRVGDINEPPMLDRARFEVFIFNTEGRQPGGISVGELRGYLADYGNVAVYDAGFRLPYYGSGRDAAGHDWLSIALDQGRRINSSELLPEHLRVNNKYMQDLPAPGRIFGAVDIDTNHERVVATRLKAPTGTWLQIQPGRDRLHDNRAFWQLRDLVRFALDYYANRHRLRSLQSAERKAASEPASRKYERAIAVLDEHKEAMPRTAFAAVKREVSAALGASRTQEEALDRRAALLAPLATAGMTALALNHELTRETLLLNRTGERLRELAELHAIPELLVLSQEFDQTRRRLSAIQEVFAPLLAANDGDPSDRLRVAPIVAHAVGALRVLMPGVAFSTRGIDTDLRFPVGSFAEWSALLQNVLTNAWNATLQVAEPKVRVSSGHGARNRDFLRVSDNGVGLGLPITEADRLFEPFERALNLPEDQSSIAIGGQGLGLAIVRMIAHRRSATVAFVDPEVGYSTTIELSWKGVAS